MTITSVFYDNSFKGHVSSLNNPECSSRVENILELIKKEDFKNISIFEPDEIDIKLINDAHAKDFVAETILRFPNNEEIVYLDQETPVSKDSKLATLKAAGSGINAADMIMKGQAKNSFCIVRPPGHHACYDRSMGFCVFNNVAILAHHLINTYNFDNIAIIDFDVHHGNGTQDIFYNNPKVHYYSTHQYPLYPGTGDTNETGCGNIINVPLKAGTGSKIYHEIFDQRIMQGLDKQKPDFIILSAGFDAHTADPLASLNLVEKDFEVITEKLKSLANQYCGGKIVSMLEGGYDIHALEQSMLTHLKVLQNND